MDDRTYTTLSNDALETCWNQVSCVFPCLSKGPSPGLAILNRQMNHIHHALPIESVKYCSIAGHENSWNFKQNAARPPFQGTSTLGQSQGHTHKCANIKRSASYITHHGTRFWLIIQCTMLSFWMHRAAKKGRKKKKRGRARCTNKTQSLGSGMAEGREGTSLAEAHSRHECPHWQWHLPPGGMVKGQLISSLSKTNEFIKKIYKLQWITKICNGAWWGALQG